jgi:hypothetical protein
LVIFVQIAQRPGLFKKFVLRLITDCMARSQS